MITKFFPAATAAAGLLLVVILCAMAVWPAVSVFTESPFPSQDMDEGVGVVILAPGGARVWQKAVTEAAAGLGDRFPVEVAFGEANRASVRIAVQKLMIRGADRAILIPLMTSSYSIAMHRTRYMLGLEDGNDRFAVVAGDKPVEMPFVLGDAMNADPALAGIIADRAQTLSRNPEKETLILLGGDLANVNDAVMWSRDMAKLAARVKAEVGFRRVEWASLSDDAYGSTLGSADRNLRQLVLRESRKGRVILIPVTMDRILLEIRTPYDLKGLRYTLDNKSLLSNRKMVDWLRQSVDRQLIRLNWEKLAGDSVVMSA